MQIEVLSGGVMHLRSADGRVAVGPSTPRLEFTTGGHRHDWGIVLPHPIDDATESTASLHPSGSARLELRWAAAGDDTCVISARIVNRGSAPLQLHRFRLLDATDVAVGIDPREWRVYRNGFQSWAGTHTIGVSAADRGGPTRWGRTGATDRRHRSPSDIGHVRSDLLSVVCEPNSDDALGVGFTTAADAFGFVEIIAPEGDVQRFGAWLDLDDVELEAGAATVWFELVVTGVTGRATAGAGNRALATVSDAIGTAMHARGTDIEPPSGWCSWYYYFAKVTEADVRSNLAILAADGRSGPTYGCEYVMIDDGHQSAIGDWTTTRETFPSGMADLASGIRSAGFDAGIWWAPFIVSSRSAVARAHPDWLVRSARGRPIVALVNPAWGATTPMWALDTTHPEVLEHLTATARTIGSEWGYRIQKIDFLYAAALEGVRHDRSATRAEALRRGLEAVRAGVGPDGFILGCGCPLGPSIGLVDAMRIGADVTPSWTSAVGRTFGRNLHGLATAHAIMNTLTRSAFDRRFFVNDPDCLMVRDTDTRLTEEEVRLLCTVSAMTDGMLVLSDDLAKLPTERSDLIARTRELSGGKVDVIDLFDRSLPELIVSRHEQWVDVAFVNLTERALPGRVDLRGACVVPSSLELSGMVPRNTDIADDQAPLSEFWTGSPVVRAGDVLDLGPVPPHAARVVRLGIAAGISSGTG